MFKRLVWYGFLCGLLFLAACDNEADTPLRATPYTPPAAIPWQRPQAVITAANAAQLQLLGILDGHTDSVYEAVFSSNAQRLATLGGDNRLVIWNMASGRSLMSAGETTFSDAFFLPGNDEVLTLNSAQQIQKWSVLENKLVKVVEASQQRITASTLTPDGAHLVIGDLNGEISIFDTATLERTQKFSAQAIGNPVRGIFYSNDGNRVYTIGQEGITYQWNSETWSRLGTIEENVAPPLYSAVSPDQSLLVLARDEIVNIFDTNTGSLRYTYTIPPFHNIQQIAFSEDNTWMAIGGDIDSVVIFEVTSGDLVVALREHGQNFKNLAFSPDRTLIATSLDGGGVFLWNLTSLMNATPSASPTEIQIPRATLTQVPDLQLSQLRWSPDGLAIILTDRRGAVYMLGIPS